MCSTKEAEIIIKKLDEGSRKIKQLSEHIKKSRTPEPLFLQPLIPNEQK
jgi:hypothetical protein